MIDETTIDSGTLGGADEAAAAYVALALPMETTPDIDVKVPEIKPLKIKNYYYNLCRKKPVIFKWFWWPIKQKFIPLSH